MISKSFTSWSNCLGVGLYLIINTQSLVKFITILIGITICIKSIVKLQFAINIRNFSTAWKYNLVFSLLGITLGVLLLANPFESAQTFLRIIGVVMIIGSVMELIECAFLMKNLNIKRKKQRNCVGLIKMNRQTKNLGYVLNFAGIIMFIAMLE